MKKLSLRGSVAEPSRARSFQVVLPMAMMIGLAACSGSDSPASTTAGTDTVDPDPIDPSGGADSNLIFERPREDLTLPVEVASTSSDGRFELGYLGRGEGGQYLIVEAASGLRRVHELGVNAGEVLVELSARSLVQLTPGRPRE